MLTRILSALSIVLTGLAGLPSAAQGALEAERANIIHLQRQLKTLRQLEQESRHLHFLQANAILSVYGGWTTEGRSYGTHADLLKEASRSMMLPNAKRGLNALERNKVLSEVEKSRLASALDSMIEAIEISQDIAALLEAGDIEGANATFVERSLPVFEGIWSANYSLVRGTEDRLPRR